MVVTYRRCKGDTAKFLWREISTMSRISEGLKEVVATALSPV